MSMGAAPATQTKPPPATRPSIILEAEDAEPRGTLYATTRPGYSGSAYITGVDGEKDGLLFRAKSETGGLYQIDLRYSAPSIKGFGLTINGIGREDFFQPTGDAFATHAGGKVELKPGDNVIELNKNWGSYDLDRIELIPTDVAPLQKPTAALVNPNATPAAKALMQTLVDGYGHGMFSGVHTRQDAKLVLDRTGRRPMVMGADLIEYTPSRVERGSNPGRRSEELIEDIKAGHIGVVMWHWNAPSGLIDKRRIEVDGKMIDASWYRGFYTEAVTFDLTAALADRDGADYKLLLRDIDVIAVELKKFDAAGVPIIWRPLHEADGGWFWWGAKGPDAFKQLWAIVYDRITNHHKLNNLIWMYTGTTKWDWYPPDNQFDSIGVDYYPKDQRDPVSGLWDALQARYGQTKLLALSEIGGVPDAEAMKRLGIQWSFFYSWTDELGPRGVEPARLKELYSSPLVKNHPGPTTQPTP
jgi:mannan endo-1,4-beta-mannosidase